MTRQGQDGRSPLPATAKAASPRPTVSLLLPIVLGTLVSDPEANPGSSALRGPEAPSAGGAACGSWGVATHTAGPTEPASAPVLVRGQGRLQ